MKSWVAVTLTWVVALQSSAWIGDAITLDLANPTKDTYSTFLTSVRNDVKDPKLVYGGTTIPVIAAPTNTYLRIDLKVAAGTVSLGLKRNDLYAIAILYKNDKSKTIAYYFKGQITSAQLDKLFPEAKGAANQKEITEYKENYASLETAAKATRKQAGLGIGKLVTYLEKVNGKARTVQNEAKFLLVAIQMVSEAARFGYIQKVVLDHFPDGFTPDDKVIILERNWDRISLAVKGSTKGVFKEALVLKADGAATTWTVKNAGELNMGLLSYQGKAIRVHDSSLEPNNDGHQESAVI